MIEFWNLNWWAIIVTAVAVFALGMLWYGPLFGKTWMRLAGITPDPNDKEGIGCKMVINFITNLVFAWGLAVFLGALGVTTVGLAFCVAATIWGCFITMNYVGEVLWEKTSWKLFFFNTAHNLVAILLMALILVNWQ